MNIISHIGCSTAMTLEYEVLCIESIKWVKFVLKKLCKNCKSKQQSFEAAAFTKLAFIKNGLHQNG